MEPTIAFNLANGLRCILAEDHAAAAAAVGVWVRAGVCEEPPGQRGIAHFFEHMMFRGSAAVGPEEHARRIARLGGDCNAGTNFDFTVYHEQVPASAVEEAFRLEADRFRALRLQPDLLDVERKVVLEEVRVFENQPLARAFRDILLRVSGGHPYALTPLGKEEDLRGLTVGDLDEFRRAWYRPENCTLIVVGDVTRPQCEDLAGRHFGDWRGEGAAPARPAVPYRMLTGELALPAPLHVPVAVRIHQMRPSEQEDGPAIELLAAMLTWGKTGAVYRRLVQERKLCVYAGGMAYRLGQGGALILFGAFLPPASHRRRQAALADLCAEVAQRGPDERELARHACRFRAHRASELYSPQQRMMGLGEAEMIEGGFARYERLLEELAAVTPLRVRDLAARLFAPENTLALNVRPEKVPWWMWPVGLGMRMIGR